VIRTRFKFIILLSGVAAFVCCGGGDKGESSVVAEVDDQKLTLDQMQYSVPEGASDELALGLKKEVISRWVESEALYKAALDEGVSLSEKDLFLVKKYEKFLLVQRFLDERLNRTYQISQKEIDNYYQLNQKEFTRLQEEVHIVHLYIEQRDNEVFSEISRADNLLGIIRKYYFNEKSSEFNPNGDLGYVAVSSLNELLASALKRMKTGSISAPIKSEQGYHFLQLLDWQRAGSVRDAELVKNEILLRIRTEHREQEYQRILKNAREDVQIQTYLSKIQ
jgi:foldase protein PrsA